MRIPNSVNKLTLEQYSAFRKIEAEATTDMEKGEKLLSLVSGLTLDQINDMPIYKVRFYFQRIADLRATQPTRRINNTLWINGKRFKCTKSEHHLNMNQFVTADTFMSDTVTNLDKLAAIAYVPCMLFGKPAFNPDKFDEYSKLFSKQKVGSVYGALFFYSNKLQQLKEISQHYLSQAEATINNRMNLVEKELEALGVNMAGTISSIVLQVEMLSKKTS